VEFQDILLQAGQKINPPLGCGIQITGAPSLRAEPGSALLPVPESV
jgi:hypothetical protein